MSADVIPLDDKREILDALANLMRQIEAGTVRGVCLVAIHDDGGFWPLWHATKHLGPHSGSVLRGAVCWLGAAMDAKARGE